MKNLVKNAQSTVFNQFQNLTLTKEVKQKVKGGVVIIEELAEG